MTVGRRRVRLSPHRPRRLRCPRHFRSPQPVPVQAGRFLLRSQGNRSAVERGRPGCVPHRGRRVVGQKATQLTLTATEFNKTGIEWEGTAAEAADVSFGAYRAWVEDLARSLAPSRGRSHRNLCRHIKPPALSTHPFSRSTFGSKRMRRTAILDNDLGSVCRSKSGWPSCTSDSDEIRQRYARNSTTQPAIPGDIPKGVVDSGPVSPSEAPGRPGSPMPQSPTGSGSDGAGGGPAPTHAVDVPDNGHVEASGFHAGGADGRCPVRRRRTFGRRRTVGWRRSLRWRAPSGGGAPGRWLPGGLPGGGPSTGAPKLPTDPSLRPAAASGGGAGGGGGGCRGRSAPVAVRPRRCSRRWARRPSHRLRREPPAARRWQARLPGPPSAARWAAAWHRWATARGRTRARRSVATRTWRPTRTLHRGPAVDRGRHRQSAA